MSSWGKDLGVRTLINGSSAILIALFIFLAHYPTLRWFFAAAVASVGAIANWEYDQLLAKKGLSPAISISLFAVILYLFSVFFNVLGSSFYFTSVWRYVPEMVLGLAFLACFIFYAVIEKPPIINIATTFLGILYISYPLGLFITIMYFFAGGADPHLEGSWWIVYLLAATKSADIGGYFIGSYLGKKKLALKLSPNKTLEGALGGLLASILASIILCFLGRTYGNVFNHFSYVQALWLGLIIGILGQIGDLAESFLKRDAGVKDSNTIPGVGGILDMIDSLLFTTPVVYLFLRMVYHHYL